METPNAPDERNAWRIYSALLFGTFVTIEAAAFQAPAMPALTRHFGIPINLAALILLCYFMALTVLAPIMAGAADRVGRRRVLLFGLAVFAASEVLAAVAPHFALFLIARFLQGFGVACIIPGVFAYINHLFQAHQRGTALGILTAAMTLGAASGGLLGGLLIDGFGWPSVYWISGILALLGLLLVARMVPEMPLNRTPGGFDWAGAALLLLTIASLLSVPTWAGNFGLGSPQTVVAFTVGIAALTVLWRVESKVERPVVDLSVLRRRAFALPSAIYWLHLLCFSGLLYALAFFVNGRPGGSAAQFGFVALFLYGASMVGALVAGRVADRMPPKWVSLFALCGTLGGLLLYVQIGVDTPLWFIIVTVIVLGLMMGTNSPAVMKMALGTVPPQKMGAGTGLFSMLRDLGSPTGSSFALAVFGTTMAMQKGKGPEALAAALNSVGWLLIGLIAFNLVLGLLLPRIATTERKA